MTTRRHVVTGLGTAAALALGPRAVHAQPSAKVWRIGVLETTSLELNARNFDAFRQGLKDRGYVEGQNLAIDYRSAAGVDERFPVLASELLGLKVDLFLTRGTLATLAANNASGSTPVVMVAIADPFRVVASIARPGAKVTGLTSLLQDLYSKRLELLKDMMPGLKRIAVLSRGMRLALGSTTETSRTEIERAAPVLGIAPHFFDIQTSEEIGRAFELAMMQGVEALIIGTETLTQENRTLIAELALKHRLPAIYGAREFVDAGGLISFGVNYLDLYRRTATYIDRIFKGANPGDLPIEQPTKFELIVNLKAAKAIGLPIAESFLARADEVIE